MNIRNETRRSRTLKGIGTKAFGFHNTAITVPPCGSQKKSARSPKASWKLRVTWVDRRMLVSHVANRWDWLWALPSRGTPGCSRWRAGPLRPGSRRRPRPPCWSRRGEGLQPGWAEGLAWGSGESKHRKHPEEAAAPPAQTRRSSGTSLLYSSATVWHRPWRPGSVLRPSADVPGPSGSPQPASQHAEASRHTKAQLLVKYGPFVMTSSLPSCNNGFISILFFIFTAGIISAI